MAMKLDLMSDAELESLVNAATSELELRKAERTALMLGSLLNTATSAAGFKDRASEQSRVRNAAQREKLLHVVAAVADQIRDPRVRNQVLADRLGYSVAHIKRLVAEARAAGFVEGGKKL